MTRVLVTGGDGFLGRVVRAAFERAQHEVVAPTHAELELRDGAAVQAAFARLDPNTVVHLAARVGGIGANQKHPATFWRDNTLMGVNVLEGCRASQVERVVVVGTVCAYPNRTPVPFREESLWDGFPEPTNAPYGVAKRALATGLAAYRDEFGLKGAYLLPANLYGPGDNFDLQTSHVIPALIRKCLDAGDSSVTVWGTGSASREFLYVDDCADAIVKAAQTIDDCDPINLGTGREVTIAELTGMIAGATGFRGEFIWDPSKPDGQPRRSLDVSRARERLGWQATTTLEEGLRRTVAWYRAHR